MNEIPQNDYTWVIVLIMCICLSFSLVGLGIWNKDEIKDMLGLSESSSSASATPSTSPSPSPVNCEIKWASSWAPCDANICAEKEDAYAMYHYRTGVITQLAKHGGRVCDSLLQFKYIGSSPPADSSSHPLRTQANPLHQGPPKSRMM